MVKFSTPSISLFFCHFAYLSLSLSVVPLSVSHIFVHFSSSHFVVGHFRFSVLVSNFSFCLSVLVQLNSIGGRREPGTT